MDTVANKHQWALPFIEIMSCILRGHSCRKAVTAGMPTSNYWLRDSLMQCPCSSDASADEKESASPELTAHSSTLSRSVLGLQTESAHKDNCQHSSEYASN